MGTGNYKDQLGPLARRNPVVFQCQLHNHLCPLLIDPSVSHNLFTEQQVAIILLDHVLFQTSVCYILFSRNLESKRFEGMLDKAVRMKTLDGAVEW